MRPDALRAALGALLIGAALLCHLLAARAIGGHYIAYRDHIFGFFLILFVTGAIVAAIGWRFWRERRDVTLLLIGVVQVLFGIFVYVKRFDVH
jgi:hypothetical protein